MRQTLMLLLLSLSCYYSFAQSTELGVLGGVSFYSGDLSENDFGLYFENMKPAFGIFARFNFNKTFGLRASISHGQIQEEEPAWNPNAIFNRNFRSNFTEFAFIGEVNLFRIGSSRGMQLVPFAFAGGAVFNFRPETLFEGNWVELQPLGTEGQGLPGYDSPYRLTQISVPIGIGVKLDMEGWSLAFELGGRKLFTDHLDDVSSATLMYRDVLEGNGELAAILSAPWLDPETAGEQNPSYRRGGPYKDWYYIGGVSLAFEIGEGGGGYGRRSRSGRNIGCPTFK